MDATAFAQIFGKDACLKQQSQFQGCRQNDPEPGQAGSKQVFADVPPSRDGRP
jgi:hypothetical protein